MIKRNSVSKDTIYILLLFVLNILFFFYFGEDGYCMGRDSIHYFPLEHKEGVRVGYPLYLELMNFLFGKDNVFHAAAFFQAIIAAACLSDFVISIYRKFQMKIWDMYIMAGLALLPFIITIDEYVVTHQIMTESLTYPLFYLYTKSLLFMIYNKQKRYIVWSFLTTFLLSIIRSQLLLLWPISALVFFVWVMKYVCTDKTIKWRLLLGSVGMVVFLVLGILVVSKVDAFVMNLVDLRKNQEAVKEVVAEETVASEDAQTETGEMQYIPTIRYRQITSALFARVTFAMDREDVELFEDAEMKDAFMHVYNAIDRNETRYVHATKGLWYWKDVSTACTENNTLGIYTLIDYYQQNADTRYNAYYVYEKIALTLFREHWDRYLIDTIKSLPVGFVCTVFVQKAEIYALCHWITLLLFIMAIGMSFHGIHSKYIKRSAVEYMLLCVGICFIFVVVTNMIFTGIQRYLIYPMGVFYIALYVLGREHFDLILLKMKKDKR